MSDSEDFEVRSVEIPKNKLHKIKENWMKIYSAVVEHGKVQLRYNVIKRAIEFRINISKDDCKISLKSNSEKNISINKMYLDRCILFIEIILDGFKTDDAAALLKYKDVFCEKFEITEVRKMKSNHLTRAIGRVIGRQGKTKETIENFSQVKFNLINNKVFLLGTTGAIKMAKEAICRLIQGSETNSVFNKLKTQATKQKDQYGCLQTIYDDLRETDN